MADTEYFDNMCVANMTLESIKKSVKSVIEDEIEGDTDVPPLLSDDLMLLISVTLVATAIFGQLKEFCALNTKVKNPPAPRNNAERKFGTVDIIAMFLFVASEFHVFFTFPGFFGELVQILSALIVGYGLLMRRDAE